MKHKHATKEFVILPLFKDLKYVSTVKQNNKLKPKLRSFTAATLEEIQVSKYKAVVPYTFPEGLYKREGQEVANNVHWGQKIRLNGS